MNRYILSVLIILSACQLTLATDCIHHVLTFPGSGNISSPHYPGPYPAGICIMWFVFDKKPDLHVSIRIEELSIPYMPGNEQCMRDSLSFGPDHRRSLCGLIRNEIYEAEQGKFFFILFNSSSPGVKESSFLLHYSFTSVSQFHPTTSPVMRTDTTPDISREIVEPIPDASDRVPTANSSHICSFESSLEKGRIVPHLNQMRSTCSWLLFSKTSPRNGYNVLKLHFSFLNLYPGCRLNIYDGNSDRGQLYKAFSGSTYQPHDIEIIGEAAFIKLTVPMNVLVRGFVGNFSLDYERQVECLSGHQHCGNNESDCYYFEKRCNGIWDCPVSGGDERGCFYKCPGNKFSCRDKSDYCYTFADRCNGKVTCINYQDEMECSSDVCSSSKGLYLCDNRRCIYEKWVCDGTRDCTDGSDEKGCQTWTSPRIIMSAVVGSVLCSLFLVIAMSFACKVYALHNHRHQSEQGHETPLSSVEAELLRRRPPPPSYSEAMVTSRPYEEAYLELLNNNATDGHSINNNEGASNGQETSQHSSHLSNFHREPDGSGNQRRSSHRRRHRHRRRNVPPPAAASGGILSSTSQQCQRLLHRAGLAPPPYSLIDPSTEAEHSSSNSEEDGHDGDATGNRNQARGAEDESPSVENSSLSSFETSRLGGSYHSSSTLTPESSLLTTGDIRGMTPGMDNGTQNVGLSSENCDKESDESSESSDTAVDTDVVETSLSFSNVANTPVHPLLDKSDDDDGNEGGEDEDSDDCACILAEGNDAVDESRINENDRDSVCILNQQ